MDGTLPPPLHLTVNDIDYFLFVAARYVCNKYGLKCIYFVKLLFMPMDDSVE